MEFIILQSRFTPPSFNDIISYITIMRVLVLRLLMPVSSQAMQKLGNVHS